MNHYLHFSFAFIIEKFLNSLHTEEQDIFIKQEKHGQSFFNFDNTIQFFNPHPSHFFF